MQRRGKEEMSRSFELTLSLLSLSFCSSPLLQSVMINGKRCRGNKQAAREYKKMDDAMFVCFFLSSSSPTASFLSLLTSLVLFLFPSDLLLEKERRDSHLSSRHLPPLRL